MRRKGELSEGDIFICLMEWALLLPAEHLSSRQQGLAWLERDEIVPPQMIS